MKSTPQKNVRITACGTLQNFLDSSGSDNPLDINFELNPSVKDLFEAQGIPHTAVQKLEINGALQDFSYNVKDGDHIKLYPYSTDNIDDVEEIYIRPSAFIADVHLRKLVKTLRLMGIDTAFNKKWDDKQIIRLSNKERRMILTRDLGLLKDGDSRYGYWIRSTDPDQQIKEVFSRFKLADAVAPFTRCMNCNGKLRKVILKDVKNRVPPKVKKWHSTFYECTNCHQVYWKGSHFKKLKEKVNRLTGLTD
jgi:uncharacterized protein with PIN domain